MPFYFKKPKDNTIFDIVKMEDMEITLHRLSVFTADLQRITGKSMRSCQRYMQLIRDMFALEKQQQVTVFHVAEYFDTPVSRVAAFLKIVGNRR